MENPHPHRTCTSNLTSLHAELFELTGQSAYYFSASGIKQILPIFQVRRRRIRKIKLICACREAPNSRQLRMQSFLPVHPLHRKS
jgi:hypothetical protein